MDNAAALNGHLAHDGIPHPPHGDQEVLGRLVHHPASASPVLCVHCRVDLLLLEHFLTITKQEAKAAFGYLVPGPQRLTWDP